MQGDKQEIFPFSRQSPLDPGGCHTAGSPPTRVTLWDGSEAWLFTRFEDVRSILKDVRFSANPTTRGYPSLSRSRQAVLDRLSPEPSFIRMDDPAHLKYRRLISHEMSAAYAQSLTATLDREIKRCISKYPAATTIDVVKCLFMPFVTAVVCKVVGFPESDFDDYFSTVVAASQYSENTDRARRHAIELNEYLRRQLARQIADPSTRSGMIGRLIVEELLTNRINSVELEATVELVINAAIETTVAQLATGCLSLLIHSDQWESLCAHPDNVSAAVQEILRFHTVVHYNASRAAVEDVELGGASVRKGDAVLAQIALANRDPHVFHDPNTFDTSRAVRENLAFSFGTHFCAGHNLARAILVIAFGALASERPNMRLAVPPQDLHFESEALIFGMAELPVKW